MGVEHQLKNGLAQLGLSMDHQRLFDYLSLLSKWNHAYNLTAIRDVESMVSRHVLDSLAILPWIHGKRLLDVGTGAGLPGIPLAIANPHLHIVLLDSNGKKIRFLHEVKRVLALDTIEIVQARAEDYRPSVGFDTIMSRAFAQLQVMTQCTQHLRAKDGIWLAMKGHRPDEELAVLPHAYRVESYTVPGVEGQRCCVIIKPSEITGE